MTIDRDDAALPHWPLPLWIAHRGAGKLAPENTLAAFRVGAAHGYRAFECDVKLSADGVPFLMHDTTLDRTTPERGVAGERSWAELSRIDAGGWLAPEWAGEPLPSLDGIAAWLRRNGHALDLEIKPTPGLERETGGAVGAACAALWPDAAPPLVFSSFRTESLAGVRETAPQFLRALLVDTLWDGWFDAARDLGCGAVIGNHRLIDGALVRRLRAAGMRALCYTVNDTADARRLLALGIDGLITDAVDRFDPRAVAVGD